jgi:hypothetical protein
MLKLKPIIPKGKLFDIDAFKKDIERDMDNAGYDAMSLFEDVTRTWSHRPNFYMRKLNASRVVGTKDKIFTFVDLGTRPHTIRPKRAGGVLRFKAGGFKAKTKPGRLSSNRGAPGKQWVSSKGVQHPGTEPRGFSEAIGKRMSKQLDIDIKKSLRRATGKK